MYPCVDFVVCLLVGLLMTTSSYAEDNLATARVSVLHKRF